MGAYDMDIGENIGGLSSRKTPMLSEVGSVVDEYNYGGLTGNDMQDILDTGSANPLKKTLGDTTTKTGFDLGNAFSAKNIGGTLQGIGAIAGAAAGIYDAYNRKKYQDKVFKMEDKRVARETARQDKQQAAYEKVFG